MAISEEEIKLILNTQDSKTQVHVLATEVQFLSDRMEVLARDFNEGRISEAQYVTSSQMVSDMLRDRSALTEEVARQTGILDKSHRDIGQTLLQTSYAVQDFTSQLDSRGLSGALSAVQNNIPGILSGLGAGAGLAGVVSVLTVALGAALPHLRSFFGAMDAAKVKEAADELKKVQAEADAMLKAPQDEPGKATAAAFGQYEQRGMGLSGAVTEAIKTAADREIATPQEAAQVAEHELHGGGFIPEMLGLSISPETLQKRLEDRTKERASRLIAESGKPGAVGKAARERLRKLATDNPNLFPNDFAQFLGDVDEDPAERAAAEAAIEDDDPDSQYSAAHKAGMASRNAARDAADRAAKLQSRVADTYVDDAKINEQEIARQAAAKDKAAREAATAAKHAAAEAKRAADDAKRSARERARASDPSNVRNAQAQELEDYVSNLGANMERAGELGVQTPQSMRHLASRVIQELPTSGGDMAQLFRDVANEAVDKYRREQMRRLQMMSNQRGGQ